MKYDMRWKHSNCFTCLQVKIFFIFSSSSHKGKQILKKCNESLTDVEQYLEHKCRKGGAQK